MPVSIDSRKAVTFVQTEADTITRIHMYDAPASLQAHAWDTMSLVPHVFGDDWWTVGTFTYEGARRALACRHVIEHGAATLHYGIPKD